jgi:hypothetical protein
MRFATPVPGDYTRQVSNAMTIEMGHRLEWEVGHHLECRW